MDFNTPKGIFLQIADQMSERILSGEWQPGERIPSIRELAAQIGVNPNTVTKSYQALVDQGCIQNQRGMGFFVCDNAQETIRTELRSEFLNVEIPRIRNAMKRLNLDVDELVQLIGEVQ